MVTVVIGGGQAGLAVSHELGRRGVSHEVLEREQVAHAWRTRWDSFTLVTPNWTLDLPDSPYTGDDPEGHVPRDDIVSYLEDYARDRTAGPIREGVGVESLRPGSSHRFRLETTAGPEEADTVVVCTGAYQRPHRPAALAGVPDRLAVLDPPDYRNPAGLPDGGVLIVGAGQTGVQLAEELHLAGRQVVLACGRAPWAPRRLSGQDIVTWLDRAGLYDQSLAALPSPQARLVANVQTTGARGGHDLHFRVLQDLGVTLAGRLTGFEGSIATFADDLAESVAFGDARFVEACRLIVDRFGDAAPPFPEVPPFVCRPPTTLDLDDFGSVILTTGFRPDYSWLTDLPVLDDLGFPVVDENLATAVPGLHFCGVHFLRNRRSSLLFGVGHDAAVVATTIAVEVRT